MYDAVSGDSAVGDSAQHGYFGRVYDAVSGDSAQHGYFRRVSSYDEARSRPILNATLNIAVDNMGRTTHRLFSMGSKYLKNFSILRDERRQVRFRRYVHNG